MAAKTDRPLPRAKRRTREMVARAAGPQHLSQPRLLHARALRRLSLAPAHRSFGARPGPRIRPPDDRAQFADPAPPRFPRRAPGLEHAQPARLRLLPASWLSRTNPRRHAGRRLHLHGHQAEIIMLALFGGKPVRTKPFPSWPIFGKPEEQRLLSTLRSGQ